MKSKNIIISLISGFIIGFVVRDRLSHLQKLTPEKALQYAKDTFQQHSPINGSWIYMKPKKLEKNGLIYDTYQGGISKNIKDQMLINLNFFLMLKLVPSSMFVQLINI